MSEKAKNSTANTLEINGKRVQKLKQNRKNPEYKTEKQQVFIVGSKGIPANYGGYETFVEKLTEYQVSKGIRYHVARIASDTQPSALADDDETYQNWLKEKKLKKPKMNWIII